MGLFGTLKVNKNSADKDFESVDAWGQLRWFFLSSPCSFVLITLLTIACVPLLPQHDWIIRSTSQTLIVIWSCQYDRYRRVISVVQLTGPGSFLRHGPRQLETCLEFITLIAKCIAAWHPVRPRAIYLTFGTFSISRWHKHKNICVFRPISHYRSHKHLFDRIARSMRTYPHENCKTWSCSCLAPYRMAANGSLCQVWWWSRGPFRTGIRKNS